MFDSLWPHEPQHTRPPCPSPTPGVYPNSCPLNWWRHPTISSSVIPFSSCLQSFPTSGSFQMSQLFPSGGQNAGVSASISALPMNTQNWSPLEWTDWISLHSKGLSRVFSNTTVQKHQISSAQLSLYSNSHIHTWLLEIPYSTRWTFVDKVMSLLFNVLSRLVITVYLTLIYDLLKTRHQKFFSITGLSVCSRMAWLCNWQNLGSWRVTQSLGTWY